MVPPFCTANTAATRPSTMQNVPFSVPTKCTSVQASIQYAFASGWRHLLPPTSGPVKHGWRPASNPVLGARTMTALLESPPARFVPLHTHNLHFCTLQVLRAAIDGDDVGCFPARRKHQALHCLHRACHCTVSVWIDLPQNDISKPFAFFLSIDFAPIPCNSELVLFSLKTFLSSSDMNPPLLRQGRLCPRQKGQRRQRNSEKNLHKPFVKPPMKVHRRRRPCTNTARTSRRRRNPGGPSSQNGGAGGKKDRGMRRTPRMEWWPRGRDGRVGARN